MPDLFYSFSIRLGVVCLGVSSLLLVLSSPWMVFLPLALWVGWIQVGSL
jgi:hypothetical protein